MNWTEEQQAIINHGPGHAKVSAVAGSGKSATLVERVARLLTGGVDPAKLQVVMFNASASSSFNHRLRSRLSGSGIGIPEVRTFHSIGMRLCESLARYGCLPNWRLETQDWKESRMATEAIEAVIQEKPAQEDIESFLDFIGLVKSDIISADDKFPEATEITGKPMPDYFVEAYARFEELRALAGIRFFSDLIHDPVMKLLSDDVLASKIGNRLDHLLVDEYQDINEVQQALITIIAGDRASVMVVGDSDQCVYEWRGARPEYLESLFDADFEDATNYRLSYTFRYGHRVSLLANHVISMNERLDEKLCLSHESTGDTLISMLPDKGNANAAVDALKGWVDQGRSLSEVAILVRLYGMSVPLELALLKERIPYQLDGRSNVFKRREAQMLLGYIRIAAGCLQLPSPDGSSPMDYMQAMLGQPSIGVNKKSLENLADILLTRLGEAEDAVDAMIIRERAPAWMARKLRTRARLLDKASQFGLDGKASELMGLVRKSLSLEESLLRESIREETGRDKIEVCNSMIEFFGERSVAEVMNELDELMSESAANSYEGKPSAVTITSIHKAKGLEWPLVIVPGLREGSLPVKHADEDGPRLEAERRLCYVAFTRAREHLLLLHPEDTDLQWHSSFGIQGPSPGSRPIASRFLYEANFQVSDDLGSILAGKAGGQVNAVSNRISQLYVERLGVQIEVNSAKAPPRVGGPICGPATPFRGAKNMRVTHDQFGSGLITEVIPRAGTHAIRVDFDRGGSRIIIAHQSVLSEEAPQAGISRQASLA